MSAVGLYGKLIADVPGNAFSYAKTGSHTRNDTAAAIGAATGYTLAGTRVVPEAGILTLEPTPYPTDTLLTDWTTTHSTSSASWVQQLDQKTGKRVIALPDSTPDATFTATTLATIGPDRSFYMRLGWGEPAAGATINTDNVWRIVSVGGDVTPSAANGAQPWALYLQYGRVPFLQLGIPNPDGTDTWYWGAFGENGVQGTVISDDLFDAAARTIMIEVLMLPSANMLIVDLGGGRDRLVITPSNKRVMTNATAQLYYVEGDNLSIVDGRIQVSGQNGITTIQYLPLRFPLGGSVVSPTIPLNFVYQGNVDLSIPGAIIPDGTTLDGAFGPVDETGLNMAYTLVLTAAEDSFTPGFAATTPVIPSVLVNIPPTYGSGILSIPVIIPHTAISEIMEEQWVERHGTADGSFAMAVRSRLAVKFDNGSGWMSGYNGNHLAIRWERGATADGVEVTDYLPFMEGWGGMDSSLLRSDPYKNFDMIVEDRTFSLADVQRGPQDYKDGWCCFAAMADEAIKGGIHPAFLDPIFLQCEGGPNPPNCPHFKLPIGTAQSPRSAWSPMVTFWDVIMSIAGMIHAVVGWDRGSTVQPSMLRIVPYYPSVYEMPYYGVFTTGDPEYLSGVRGMSDEPLVIKVNTSDRRTGILFGGTDAQTRLPQITYLNLDDFPGFENFTERVQGYRKPLVVISNLFTDPLATVEYAFAALQKISMPTLTASHGWHFLPDMAAMYQYDLDAPKELAGLPSRFTAETVRSRWTNPATTGTRICNTSIASRSMYNA